MRAAIQLKHRTNVQHARALAAAFVMLCRRASSFNIGSGIGALGFRSDVSRAFKPRARLPVTGPALPQCVRLRLRLLGQCQCQCPATGSTSTQLGRRGPWGHVPAPRRQRAGTRAAAVHCGWGATWSVRKRNATCADVTDRVLFGHVPPSLLELYTTSTSRLRFCPRLRLAEFVAPLLIIANCFLPFRPPGFGAFPRLRTPGFTW